MKRVQMAGLAMGVLLLTAVGCSKQKDCRCAVKGSSVVRIIKIEKGECEQITTYSYHDNLDSLSVDTLYCTGHEFAIDSIFND
ncbi:MAG: hypothetical protein IJU19_04140 [Bacteroidales bacterium]|nr:hypothetical protein [Bacteroidales bacterium]